MDPRELARWRMRNLRLTGPPGDSPEEVVRRLGAVQSQDYGPAKWSIGQRTRSATDASLDRAYTEGTVLRTHVLRPTWHFVLPEDIRWLLAVTAPRVHALNGYLYRQNGLDEPLRQRAAELMADALRGGNRLTRKEIGAVLAARGIEATGVRLTYFVMHAELAGLICSGGLRGRQHTYALLDERAPDAQRLTGDEALARLTLRYFTGHGPATARDLAAWASLTAADVTRGLDLVSGRLDRLVLDGRTYWYADAAPEPEPTGPVVHLLQGYDEYVVGYRESRGVLDLAGTGRVLADRPGYTLVLLVDTQFAGHWKRTVTKDSVTIQVAASTPFSRSQLRALGTAGQRHGRFLGLPVRVEPPTLV